MSNPHGKQSIIQHSWVSVIDGKCIFCQKKKNPGLPIATDVRKT